MFSIYYMQREEEELRGNIEPMRIEEPKRVAQRGMSEEQHNDIKLSVVETLGMNQIEVALRV